MKLQVKLQWLTNCVSKSEAEKIIRQKHYPEYKNKVIGEPYNNCSTVIDHMKEFDIVGLYGVVE